MKKTHAVSGLCILLLVLMFGCATTQVQQQQENSAAVPNPPAPQQQQSSEAVSSPPAPQQQQSSEAPSPPAADLTVEVPAAETASRGFILGPNDIIKVTVFRNQDLNTSVKIDPNGTIMLPLIGEISAAGKDLNTLKDEITASLSTYLVDPQVSVNIDTIGSQKYIVLGEVERPGVFALNTKTSLFEAVSSAGGNTVDAKLSNIVLVRKGNDKTVVSLHNMKSGLKDGQLDQNTIMQNGDIVYVPAITVANVSRFFTHIGRILSPIVNLESGIVLWPDVKDVVFKNGPGDAALSITTGN